MQLLIFFFYYSSEGLFGISVAHSTQLSVAPDSICQYIEAGTVYQWAMPQLAVPTAHIRMLG